MKKEQLPKEIFELQKEHFQSNGQLTFAERIYLLEQLLALLIKEEKKILTALYDDLKKSAFEGYSSEVSLVKEEAKYAIKNLRKWIRPQKVKTPLFLFKGKSYIHYSAKGVVLIMAPWNYPFSLAALPLVAAIAAGNRVIIKPSEISTHTSGLINDLIGQYFEEKDVAVIEGDASVSSKLLDLPFDHIFFTGSTAVGKIVYQKAAQNLIPVTLELGGKSPAIIDSDANIKLSARKIVWGKFLNAGQTCIAPDYVLVHQKIRDEFILALKETIKEFFGEDPKSSQSYARIISQKHYNYLMDLLSKTKEKENLIYGGESDDSERYISPTIMFLTHIDGPLMEQEIFGPILPIMDFEKREDIYNIIKMNPSPLAFYYFSNNSENYYDFLTQVPFGSGAINDTVVQIANHFLPFGGIGPSGMGQYHGYEGFLTFSHRKSIFYRSNLVDLPIRYPPYSEKKMKWLRFFLP